MQIWSLWWIPISNRRFKSSGLCLYMVEIFISWNQHLATKEIQAPDKSWGGCNKQTSIWPYQGHRDTHLVPRTASCLSALWSDSDHWTHAPRVYCVTANSWWVLHSWIIEDPLWDDSRSLHSRVPERSSYPIQHIIRITHQLTKFATYINRHTLTTPLDSFTEHKQLRKSYLWKTTNMSLRTHVIVKQMQSNLQIVHRKDLTNRDLITIAGFLWTFLILRNV